jgi:hypothetical protein
MFHERLLKLYSEREKTSPRPTGGQGGQSYQGGAARRPTRKQQAKFKRDRMTEKLNEALAKQKAGKKLNMIEARLILEKNFENNE